MNDTDRALVMFAIWPFMKLLAIPIVAFLVYLWEKAARLLEQIMRDSKS